MEDATTHTPKKRTFTEYQEAASTGTSVPSDNNKPLIVVCDISNDVEPANKRQKTTETVIDPCLVVYNTMITSERTGVTRDEVVTKTLATSYRGLFTTNDHIKHVTRINLRTPQERIDACIEWLVDEGHAYSTVDEDHFRVCEGSMPLFTLPQRDDNKYDFPVLEKDDEEVCSIIFNDILHPFHEAVLSQDAEWLKSESKTTIRLTTYKNIINANLPKDFHVVCHDPVTIKEIDKVAIKLHYYLNRNVPEDVRAQQHWDMYW